MNTNPDKRFIIAPHDIGEERLKECESLYKNAIRYSQYKAGQFDSNGKNVLLIDNIGMLKFLYRYGTICYVGGGFGGDGVHNVLEAAVYQKPVIFGPVYDKFIEASGLIQYEGAFSIEDALELETVISDLLEDEAYYLETAKMQRLSLEKNRRYRLRANPYIQANLLLTN